MNFISTLSSGEFITAMHEHTHAHDSVKEAIIHILSHSFFDALKALPLLFLVYLFIEYLEHKNPQKLENALKKMGPFGAVGGALIGCIPQCGFSVAAANLYSGKVITTGTIIAVFISTSDEALPIILAEPKMFKTVFLLILTKLVIAITAGLVCDLVLRLIKKPDRILEGEGCELCSDDSCDCEHHSVLYSAVYHTVSIFIFILLINLLLNGAMEALGQEKIEKLLMTNSALQPFVAALIGFIPNCAASVILTELFIAGSVSFGSLIAGLCTGAGMGLLVMLRTNKNKKAVFCIMAVLYAVAVLSGVILNAII